MPETYVQVANLIEDEFKDLWGSTTYVHWPNTRFAPPSKGTSPASPAAWVRPTVSNGEAKPASPGAAITKHARHPGSFIVDVFQQDQTGDAIATGHAQTIGAHFELRNLSGIHMGAATVRTIGPKDGWHQVKVSVPFWWDSGVGS